jgi:hypothetical protein
MWHWALELSRTRKARSAAVAAISPILDQSRHRLGGVPDAAWSDPYIIGFMIMLISIIARIETGRIAGDSLCKVQRKAWEDITRTNSNMMIEEMMLLDTTHDREFELGCRNAATLGSLLLGNSVRDGGAMLREEHSRDATETQTIEPLAQREDVSAAWIQFFETYILTHRNQDANAVAL